MEKKKNDEDVSTGAEHCLLDGNPMMKPAHLGSEIPKSQGFDSSEIEVSKPWILIEEYVSHCLHLSRYT